MTEPLTLSAAVVTALAFQKFVEGVGSETGKKFADKAFGLIDQLRQKILARFKGQDKIQKTLEKAQNGESEGIQRLAKYLDVEMMDDEEFTQELQQLVQEINQYVIEDNSTQVQVNHGGTNFQNKITGGEVYQGNVTVNKT